MDKQDIKNLKKRYLIWFYKTTKEALDKIERKFTQLDIDNFVLAQLERLNKDKKVAGFIDEFRVYIQNKAKDGLSLKFKGEDLNPEYHFLTIKLKAVEKAIVKELGLKGLKEIKALYENEMTQRILKSTEH